MMIRRRFVALVLLLVLGGLAGIIMWPYVSRETASPPQAINQAGALNGRLLSVISTQTLSADQVMKISRENYGAGAPRPIGSVIKALITYSSVGEHNEIITEYARLYVPAKGKELPVFGFAPGTTGIGDQCAASLEQPQIKNWQNYESHMLTYAGQGYASVIPDYEGMRDPARLHHYMVGEMEGRALLDSIKAMQKWNGAKGRLDNGRVFVGGFSQGGHSAMWADKIASRYTPSLQIKGVVNFGPVSDVERTLADVTRGANINWFGPFVLVSYQDYYASELEPARVLLPKWLPTLATDVTSHCIDSVITHWGTHPEAVYTPEFLQALSTNSLEQSGYALLHEELASNTTGDQPTSSAKLINQGQLDNVILPAQQTDMLPRLCAASKGSVFLSLFPRATHYNVMEQGLVSTLAWMKTVGSGKNPPNSCAPAA